MNSIILFEGLKPKIKFFRLNSLSEGLKTIDGERGIDGNFAYFTRHIEI